MNTFLLVLFAIIFALYFVLDLFVFNKTQKKIEIKPALLQTGVWVGVAVLYGIAIWFFDHAQAYDFFSVYITEKMLSLDNLFVILLIFSYLGIEDKYQHKVLLWGIIGAIVLRALFIGLGAGIIERFDLVLYVFGAVLVWSGIKLLGEKSEKEEDMDKNKLLRFLKKYIPFTVAPHAGKFFIKEHGKKIGTMMLLALIMVELTDLIFAIDSIPASFSITTNPYVIFTANIFAVMGLRSLFFVVEYILEKYHLLTKALAIILVFIGGKLFLAPLGFHISSLTSLLILVSIFATAIVLSPYIPKSVKRL